MRFIITALFVLSSLGLFAQLSDPSQNTADRLLGGTNNLNIAGYADIDFNQPLGGGQRNNGNLDIHRLVMLFGYKFDKRTSFVTEIEFEHVKELAVEQAFVNYRVNQYFNFRGGLLLIPMGIINEYHEGPSRHGVERPNVDKFIVPTTWRELGFGFTGRIDELAMKYQVYVVNGFNGFDGSGTFTGKNGLRSGRQKGAESFASSPNLSTKLDFYGISGLKLGLAGYFGDSQSTLYDGVDKNDDAGLARADSSTVGVAMVGIDARYNIKGWELRGQFNYTSLSNTMAYNAFTGNDVGSKMSGYYLEAAYNVFQKNQEIKTELFPFFRYEQYNTHQSVERTIEQNNAFKRTELTAGLTWKMNPGTALKLDYQWLKNDADDGFHNQLNIGLGVWFY